MKNDMEIDGFKALTTANPDTNLFRGEFIDLNSGAVFYAADVKSLQREGKISLKVFLDMWREDGVGPRKNYSGKLMVRLPEERRQRAAVSAPSTGKSLNSWLADVVAQASS